MDDIHVHVHVHVIPDAERTRLTAHEGRLTVLEAQGAAMATKTEELAVLTARLNTATNEIAADLAALRQKIVEKTITDEDLAAVDAIVARLEGLGADPENPVPTA